MKIVMKLCRFSNPRTVNRKYQIRMRLSSFEVLSSMKRMPSGLFCSFIVNTTHNREKTVLAQSQQTKKQREQQAQTNQ